ncbi:galactose oxidase [Shewanella sp. JM162201]|uniref:Galactose oxidase n=1 Tax=Shewanella jiangmenensis TaxID=2837387 RepID=A0ABS5UZR4_9GAMM|nr:kelch repeat-containing protein [Shewanella jiangmenensis]MBT1443694.1 galactose oxidase [Shewanella jiangmenensis]
MLTSSLLIVSSITMAEPEESHETLLLPEAIQEIYPALVGDEVWIAGGISSELPAQQGNMTAKVHYLSQDNRAWTSAPDLPEGRHHTYLQAVGERLFAFGGFVQTQQGQWFNSDDVLMLDEERSRWRPVATLPMPLSETVAAVINNKVHLVGGRSAKGELNGQWQHSTDVDVHLVFDPQTFEFTRKASLPGARNSAATVQLGERWFVIGGRQTNGKVFNDLLEYLPAEDRWLEGPSMPEGRAGHAAAILGDKLYVFGGESAQGVNKDILVFDFKSNQWQRVKGHEIARHGLGAVTVDDHILLIGGAKHVGLEQTLNTTQRFYPEKTE